MNFTLFAVFLASVILQTLAALEQNDDQDASVNQIIENIEKKIDGDLATLKSELLDYVSKIDRSDCPTAAPKIQKSCASLYSSGERKDGIYTIDPDGYGSFRVFCDMQTGGGGWTVFQRRQDGSEDFYRGWQDYKNGFGNLADEFWLGLDYIHRLTKSGETVLRVDLMNSEVRQNEAHAEYGTFTVASESAGYKLNVGKFSGDAGDSLSYHNWHKFSTKDKDNDSNPQGNCVDRFKGGWWYSFCATSNLNGLYLKPGTTNSEGVFWYTWKPFSSLKRVEMKIRPARS